MNKGNKAIVINDCAVKAGSEVEVGESSGMEVRADANFWYRKPGELVPCENIRYCYFNGIRVEIAESNLKPVPKEMWLPKIGESYWFADNMFKPVKTSNDCWDSDKGRIEVGNCFRTEEECQKMCDKIKKLLTEDNE